MFREFINIIGDAATDMIDEYTKIKNERSELVEAIEKYNVRAALYGNKPIVIIQEKTSENTEDNETEKLKKYFSEKNIQWSI